MSLSGNVILVVEDAPGEAVLRRVLAATVPLRRVESVIDCGGAGTMKANMPRFRNASHACPHILLTDLDHYSCPLALLDDWKARSAPPRLTLRIAVREVEAWLMGDATGLSAMMKIPSSKIPAQPELVADPKQALLSLARRSRSRRFVEEFCPAPHSAASVGPLYNEYVTRFIRSDWDLDAARGVVPSLERACRRVASLLGCAR